MVAVPQERGNLRLLTPVRVVAREEGPAAAFSKFPPCPAQAKAPGELLRLVCAAEDPLARKEAARELLSVRSSNQSALRLEMEQTLKAVLSVGYPHEAVAALRSEAHTGANSPLATIAHAAAGLIQSDDGRTALYAKKFLDELLPSVGDGGTQKLTTKLLAILESRFPNKQAKSSAVALLAKIYRTADEETAGDIARAVDNAAYQGSVYPKELAEFRGIMQSAREKAADESGEFVIKGSELIPVSRLRVVEVA